MIGILLINLGTPDAPTTGAVRRYLRQFLSDPEVIDIHPLARWLLVNAVIVPFRSPKSAAAYRKIWTEEGSPLRLHTRNLAQAVQTALGANYSVKMAMRYGNPSIEGALNEFAAEQLTEIRVLPLYPQYALSSTESSVKEVKRSAAAIPKLAPLTFLPPFYDHPGFISAFASVGKEALSDFKPDHVLFSFHGLPERHLRKLEPLGMHCLAKQNCCDQVTAANKNCYRAQSFATARLIAQKLGLEPNAYSVSFQSRLGRTPWIKPYTDLVLPELAKRGVKRVAVFCPAFVADCLETLEEIQLRGRELFKKSGGEDLRLVPSLNSSPGWVETVCLINKIENKPEKN